MSHRFKSFSAPPISLKLYSLFCRNLLAYYLFYSIRPSEWIVWQGVSVGSFIIHKAYFGSKILFVNICHVSQKKQYDAIPLIFVGGGGPRQKGGGWDWWNRNGIISTFLFLRFHITLSGKSIYLDPRNVYSQNKISLFYPGSKEIFFSTIKTK